MEFNEFTNPEIPDYDISSSLTGSVPVANPNDIYVEQLMDIMGIVEDISEEELLEDYGISMLEYLSPNAETIEKVTQKLESREPVRHM